jgi:hypothetical protein
VRLAFQIPVMRTSYSLVRLRDRTVSPAAQAFTDLLRAVEAENDRIKLAAYRIFDPGRTALFSTNVPAHAATPAGA